ncbi:MAG: uracil-DNA glycosylase, partial [Woeseiaceae bacterium]|nr:uracil-DNA glycosylase [Woeseiaceae bacterium]
ACRDYLERQIEMIKPRLVLAVGRIAAQQLLHTDSPLGRLRGRAHSLHNGQVPLVVTYHPAYLLRSPAQKRKVWEDLCLARQIVQELST